MNCKPPRRLGAGAFDRGYMVRWYTAADFYASAAPGCAPMFDGAMTGQPWFGLHLDERSHYRAVLCYFDDETDPVPLVVGQVLRREFRRVGVTPFSNWTQYPSALSLPALSDTAPLLFAGQLALGYWRRPPDADRLAPCDPGQVQLGRVLAIGANVTQSNLAFLAGHLPGVKRLLFWAHNNGVNNSLTVDVSLWSLCPERVVAGTGISALQVGPQVGTTLNVPSGATLQPQRVTIVDPGDGEFLIRVSFTGTGTGGTFTAAAGITAYFGEYR